MADKFWIDDLIEGDEVYLCQSLYGQPILTKVLSTTGLYLKLETGHRVRKRDGVEPGSDYYHASHILPPDAKLVLQVKRQNTYREIKDWLANKKQDQLEEALIMLKKLGN